MDQLRQVVFEELLALRLEEGDGLQIVGRVGRGEAEIDLLAALIERHALQAESDGAILDRRERQRVELLQLDLAVGRGFVFLEHRAVAFGLQGVPIDQGGEQVYFGLAATNSTDDQQTIPFFQPDRERFLEYDLTKLIHSLAFPKKTVVGLLTSLPLEGDIMAAMQGRPLQPYAIVDQLRQLYDAAGPVARHRQDPRRCRCADVAHPQNMSDKALFAIDQYVLKGGKVLAFVDPYSETQAAHPSRFNPQGGPSASDLDKLFAAWGCRGWRRARSRAT